MATTKLLLLVAAVAAQHYGTTAPNDRPPSDELREQKGQESKVGYFTALIKTSVYTWALIESSLLFSLTPLCPPPLSRSILHFLLRVPLPTPTPGLTLVESLASLTTLTPTFLTGTLLSITSALLRAHCFHTLGRFFTFELSIRPHHRLVTSGAYAVVRHPSYTAGMGLAVGWVLCVMEPAGWVARVCLGSGGGDGDGGRGGVAMGWALGVGVGAGMVGLGAVVRRRIEREERMLEENFGEEWRAWKRRVPYRLVPWVY